MTSRPPWHPLLSPSAYALASSPILGSITLALQRRLRRRSVVDLFSPGHLIVIVILAAILFFGWKQLPDMARSAGRSMRIFRTEIKGMTEDDAARDTSRAGSAPPTVTPPATPPVTPPAADDVSASEGPSKAAG